MYEKKELNSWLNKVVLNSLIAFGAFIGCLLLLEVVYRYQLIDFYKPEITYLNDSVKHKKTKKRVLVFGDSFTASLNNYVTILNDSFPNLSFINSGIPGIGAQEINAIAKSRIDHFNPETVIIQLYVGNDLIDIKKPINWSKISFARNCFWYISNHLLSLRCINYKLGQLKNWIGQSVETNRLKNNDSFSIDKFSKREKMLLNADPFYYEKSIYVTEDYKERYETYLNCLTKVCELCNERNIAVKILIIPTSCQVNKHYQTNFKKFGAKFSQNNIQDTLYPFMTKLTKKMTETSTQVLNPLGSFQKADSISKRLYYENDIHLNKNGERVLAQFLIKSFKN